MTENFSKIVSFLTKEVSKSKYRYRSVVSDCYEMAIKQSGFKIPEEGKEEVIKKVLGILNSYRFQK
jgi:hypothetical protein